MSDQGIRFRCLASTKVRPELGAHNVETQDNTAVEQLDDEHDDEGLEDEESTDDSSVSESESDSDYDSELGTNSRISSRESSLSAPQEGHVSCIQEAQLSSDGTCIFTADYNRTFSVYPINHSIPQEQSVRGLQPYAQFHSADPIWAFTSNPHFDLNDSTTTNVLVSCRDQYITLHNALWDVSHPYSTTEAQTSPTKPVDISTKLASYKLIDPLTEQITAPTSLVYSHDASYFYAGHKNKISIFDINHTDDAILQIRTIPSNRNNLVGGGRGFKGQISALALSASSTASNTGILAAGSRTRYVGLYDSISGKEITHISLPGNTIKGPKTAYPDLAPLIGSGVTALKFSPCGAYLYVAERSSSSLAIYDVRRFSLCLAHCAGRAAQTKQKLGFDVWAGREGSHEVWAGGTDGKVRVWRDACLREGAVEADEVLDVSDGPVVASLVHPYGHLAVVASGARDMDGHDGGDIHARGKVRGGGCRPRFREWGCLDILGLQS